MHQVTRVLTYYGGVHRLNYGIVAVLLGEPVAEVGDDVLAVLDAVITRLDMVVAQILRLVGGIERQENLLCAELVHRIVALGGQQVVEQRQLLLGIARLLEDAVAPVDGVDVVDADQRRHHPHAALEITALGDIVVARVVHDRGGRAVFLRERRTAQRVHRERIARPHVMHQSQRVAHLVSGHIAQRLAHHVVVEDLLAHARIDGARLGETPVVHQRNDVVVPDDVGHQNLARAGIGVARTHGIGHVGDGIADAVVTNVIGVERRIVGIVAGLHHVLEAGGFESRVPVLDALFHHLAPLVGEGIVDIEDDLALRLDQLAAVIFLPFALFRLDAPAVDHLMRQQLVLRRGVGVVFRAEIAHAVVLPANLHRLLGQFEDRAPHGHRVAVRLGGVVQDAGDLEVLFEDLDLLELRPGGIVRRTDLARNHRALADRRDQFVVRHEERGHIDQQRIVAGGLDLEGTGDGVLHIAAERFFDGIVRRHALPVVDLVEVDVGGVGRKTDHEGIVQHLSRHEVGVLADLRNPVGQQVTGLEVAGRDGQQQFALLRQVVVEQAAAFLGALDGLVEFVLFLDGVRLFNLRGLFFLVGERPHLLRMQRAARQEHGGRSQNQLFVHIYRVLFVLQFLEPQRTDALESRPISILVGPELDPVGGIRHRILADAAAVGLTRLVGADIDVVLAAFGHGVDVGVYLRDLRG